MVKFQELLELYSVTTLEKMNTVHLKDCHKACDNLNLNAPCFLSKLISTSQRELYWDIFSNPNHMGRESDRHPST